MQQDRSTKNKTVNFFKRRFESQKMLATTGISRKIQPNRKRMAMKPVQNEDELQLFFDQ